MVKNLVKVGLVVITTLSISGCFGDSEESYLGEWKGDHKGVSLELWKAPACDARNEDFKRIPCAWSFKDKVITFDGREQYSIKLDNDKLILSGEKGKILFTKIK